MKIKWEIIQPLAGLLFWSLVSYGNYKFMGIDTWDKGISLVSFSITAWVAFLFLKEFIIELKKKDPQ